MKEFKKSLTASQECKRAGLDSLAELGVISLVATSTLHDWHKLKPTLFKTLLAGAVALKGNDL